MSDCPSGQIKTNAQPIRLGVIIIVGDPGRDFLVFGLGGMTGSMNVITDSGVGEELWKRGSATAEG